MQPFVEFYPENGEHSRKYKVIDEIVNNTMQLFVQRLEKQHRIFIPVVIIFTHSRNTLAWTL